MNFSEIVQHQNGTFSHDGDYLAISKNQELYVSYIVALLCSDLRLGPAVDETKSGD